MVASILWQPFPPCVDYPQHLALAKQLRDLALGEGGGHWVPWTYNGLLHQTTALLSLVVPIELAGRAVLATNMGLTGLAVWKVVRSCKRPTAYAFVWRPFAYSQAFAWGLVNFTLSAALATLALTTWGQLRSKARVVLLVTLVSLSLLTAIAHVLGTAVLVAGALVTVLLGKRPVRALLFLLPALVWTAVAHAANDPAPHLSWGNEVHWPQSSQRVAVMRNLLGPWAGPEDDWLAHAMGGVAVVGLAMSAAQALRPPRTVPRTLFGWLAALALVVYSTGPLVLYGCWYFYQRAGYCGLLWLASALPKRFGGRCGKIYQAAAIGLGTLSSANFVVHQLRSTEAEDAYAILQAVPRGARVAPVLDLNGSSSNWPALRGGGSDRQGVLGALSGLSHRSKKRGDSMDVCARARALSPATAQRWRSGISPDRIRLGP